MKDPSMHLSIVYLPNHPLKGQHLFLQVTKVSCLLYKIWIFLKGTQIKIKITLFKAGHSVPTNQRYLSLLAFLLLFVKNFKHIQKWREEHNDPPRYPSFSFNNFILLFLLHWSYSCFCGVFCLFILKHDLDIISFYL